MATARPISGCSVSPKAWLGSTSCRPGPTARPTPSSRTIAGTPSRHAIHCEAKPPNTMQRTAIAVAFSISATQSFGQEECSTTFKHQNSCRSTVRGDRRTVWPPLSRLSSRRGGDVASMQTSLRVGWPLELARADVAPSVQTSSAIRSTPVPVADVPVNVHERVRHAERPPLRRGRGRCRRPP